MTRSGHYRWAIWLGWAIAIAGIGLLILLDVHIRIHARELMFIPVSFGHGLILMSLNFSVQAMADTQNVAYAAAMYTFTRWFGLCIGVAIGGAAFQNGLKKQLGELHLPNNIANNAESFVANLGLLLEASVLEASALYQACILAYANAFKLVFGDPTAVAGLAAIIRLLIKVYTMDK